MEQIKTPAFLLHLIQFGCTGIHLISDECPSGLKKRDRIFTKDREIGNRTGGCEIKGRAQAVGLT